MIVEGKEYNLEDMSIDDIKLLKEKLIISKNKKNQLQLGLKIQMNSIYGAFCHTAFLCFNPNIAESITVQGQDLAKFGEKILDHYFHNIWESEVSLHKDEILKCENAMNTRESMIIYTDTDSNFLCLEEWFKLNYPGITDYKVKRNMILRLFELRLTKYIQECFEKYAKKFNVNNGQDFEMEAIFDRAILLCKKRYVMSTIWKMPNIIMEPLQSLKIIGVEIVRKNIPRYVGEKLKDFVKYILIKGNNLSLQDIIKKVKEFKKEYELQDIKDISFYTGIKDLNKYVLSDKEKLILNSKCPPQHKAAGIYNHLLYQNPNLNIKYQRIQSNNKIYWYYIKYDSKKSLVNKKEEETFAFPVDKFPNEFAPEIDLDRMFNVCFVKPLNRFVEVITGSEIPEKLVYQRKLF